LTDEQKPADKRIAALAGAGIPLRAIAESTGISLAGVQYVVKEKVSKNVDGLGDVYREFRMEMMPVIHRLVAKTLLRIDRRLDANKTDTRDLIAILKELSPMSGLTSQNDDSEKTTQVARVDLSKPENIRALKLAAAMERTRALEDKTQVEAILEGK
jgi:hypothetical protein